MQCLSLHRFTYLCGLTGVVGKEVVMKSNFGFRMD